MPKRILVGSIGFTRDGKTVYPEVGKLFDMTSAEIDEITKLEKVSGNQLIRKAVNESGDEDLAGANGSGSTTLPQGNGEADPYANLTVAQLKALAEERGVDLGDATRKDDIVTVLKAAQAPAAESEDI